MGSKTTGTTLRLLLSEKLEREEKDDHILGVKPFHMIFTWEFHNNGIRGIGVVPKRKNNVKGRGINEDITDSGPFGLDFGDA